MAGNSTLRAANKAKKDEFYTQLPDIENELRHYKAHFKDKVVFCNCDDPYESNFFKYFAMNFNALGLKKLIATCYATSPVAGGELQYYEENNGQLTMCESESTMPLGGKRPYKVEITEVKDENGDGRVDLADVEYLIKNKKNVMTLLDGNGDFRSPECVELLKQADIVCTNPPFSLFREYVAQLIEYDKKFIIIGNKNAITYKEIFPLIIQGKIWMGFRNINADMWFIVPEGYQYEKIENDKKIKHIMGCWFTNLDIPKRHENMILWKHYTPEEYPKYDNYDAINVDKVAEIPCDYDGVMGVPITFLDKYNPEQFEIIDALNRYSLMDSQNTNEKVKNMHSHTCNINGKATYYRIVIRKKSQKGDEVK